MIDITAKDVSTLRKMTGAGIMDCRNALLAAKGDMDEAKELIRKKGQQLVDKKADRETNQGLVGTKIVKDEFGCLEGRMLEVFCETDFVARNVDFQNFVLGNIDKNLKDIDVSEIVSKVGENIKVGRMPVMWVDADNAQHLIIMASYVHNKVADNLGTIGVIVCLDGPEDSSDEEANALTVLAHQIAMHVAAMKPKSISVEDLDKEFVENERRIFTEQAKESGKPDNIIEKMVEGRLRKSLKEVCLVDQAFVINPDKTVNQVLDEHNAGVVDFVRLAIGE